MRETRRAKRETERRGKTPPRYAPGRADDAVDWVGGAGWQDAESGHLTVELIMALHHDQACALHRANRVAARLSSVKRLGFPDSFEIIAMPVRESVGDEIYARLESWRRHRTDPTKRTLGRIGLGSERCGEVPLQFRSFAATRPDGGMSEPLKPETFAVLEDGRRLIGKIDAGKTQIDISNLEEEPQFVAGVGWRHDVSDVQLPGMFQVLALGRTTSEATTRGDPVFEAAGLKGHPNVVMKIARVTRLDGQMLRMAMENSIKEATGKAFRTLEIGIGRKDDLVEDNEWMDMSDDERATLMQEGASQVTIDSDGSPQLWDASVITNPDWAHELQSRSRSEETDPDTRG